MNGLGKCDLSSLRRSPDEFPGSTGDWRQIVVSALTLNRVMEAISTVSDRLEILEQKKASPAPSVSEHSNRKPSAEEHGDSDTSKITNTGLAERIFEKKTKSSDVRQKRYLVKYTNNLAIQKFRSLANCIFHGVTL